MVRIDFVRVCQKIRTRKCADFLLYYISPPRDPRRRFVISPLKKTADQRSFFVPVKGDPDPYTVPTTTSVRDPGTTVQAPVAGFWV